MTRRTLPSVSIIVCTWNRADQLEKTLLSLRDQKIPDEVSVEIVVVDNNSTDTTRDLVQRLASECGPITLRYVFEPTQGKQYALNTGVRQASHEILAFTDDDIIVSQDWVTAIARTFSEADVQLVGGRTFVLWPPSGRPDWYDENMAAVVGEVDLGEERLRPPPSGYSPAGANLVARRSLFEMVGLFSESHFRHMDHEFGARCVRLGALVSYEPSLVVLAPVSEECLSRRYFRRWYFKAGIILEEDEVLRPASGTFFGLPRWLLRRLFEDFLFVLLPPYRRSKPREFRRELRFWRNLGAVASSLYSRVRPRQYALWVEKHAQKRNNTY
jgi:glycosyltransferase involved in cell wall biosynthesis